MIFLLQFSINKAECSLWSLNKFTRAYLFQIAQEKSCDHLLIIFMKKLVCKLQQRAEQFMELCIFI